MEETSFITDFRWLTLVTFLPLAGAALLALVFVDGREGDRIQIKRFSLGVTVLTFVASLPILMEFDPSIEGFQFVEQSAWLGGLSYKLGVDGMSLPLVILTTFLMPLVILASWKVEHRVREYMAAFLVLETLMIGVFLSLDIVLFYLFFEGGLIPMFLIIGIWGGKERIYAAFKFFLYTLLGSLLMLIAIIWMITTVADSAYLAGLVAQAEAAGDPIPRASHIDVLLGYAAAQHLDPITGVSVTGFSAEAFSLVGLYLPAGIQTLLFLAFFASFAVKLPMWPVHTWLPDAHVQAPTAGSMVLAAILLKMGGYGLLRFSLPMFPEGSASFADVIFVMSIVAIVYTSLVALMQEDIKKLIAYSSVAHMGYVTLGIFSGTQQGVDGAVFQMVSHGLISAGLFMLVGVIYDRMHSREISFYGGLAERMPVYAAVMMLFAMANVGLPGTSGFVGEILPLVGVFQVSTGVALVATTGVILSAAYMLWLYWRVVLGRITNVKLEAITDMNTREIVVIAPLAVGVVVIGVYPSLVIDLFAPWAERMLAGISGVMGPGG